MIVYIVTDDSSNEFLYCFTEAEFKSFVEKENLIISPSDLGLYPNMGEGKFFELLRKYHHTLQKAYNVLFYLKDFSKGE